MAWLQVECANKKRFAFLKDRATLGSATSNSIVLPAPGVRPLHGQFFDGSRGWGFKDFGSQQSVALSPGESFSLGAFSATLISEEVIWSDHKPEIVESFRDILKSKESMDLNTTLETLRREIFLASQLPTHLETHLQNQFSEFSLLGPIESLLLRPDITDILVERFDSIWIEERGEMKRAPIQFSSAENYRIYVENLLVGAGRFVDEAHPFVDFLLKDGSRGHVIGPPLTPQSFYLSIRKPKETILTWKSLCEAGMVHSDIREIVEDALRLRKNILISGATGSGKTTLLKALLAEVGLDQRILVIEDTPELKIPRENTAFLKTRVDARGEFPPVQLRDLVKQALRMRPDRIVIGEVRGAEALDLMHAMNTGHRGCMGSLHANSARDALIRLEGLIQMAEQALSEDVTRDLIAHNVHLVLHCGKKDGQRKVLEAGILRGVDQSKLLVEVVTC